MADAVQDDLGDRGLALGRLRTGLVIDGGGQAIEGAAITLQVRGRGDEGRRGRSRRGGERQRGVPRPRPDGRESLELVRRSGEVDRVGCGLLGHGDGARGRRRWPDYDEGRDSQRGHGQEADEAPAARLRSEPVGQAKTDGRREIVFGQYRVRHGRPSGAGPWPGIRRRSRSCRPGSRRRCRHSRGGPGPSYRPGPGRRRRRGRPTAGG